MTTKLVWLFVIAALVFGAVYATDVTVTLTGNNVAPTVDAVTNLGATAPGTTITFRANFTDTNGYEDMASSNLTCWGTGSTEGAANSWDHYTNTTPIKLNVDVDTNQSTFTIALDNHAINGTWTCKVWVIDATGAMDSDTDSFTINTRSGLLLNETAFTASGNPGTNDVALSNPLIKITHDGNYFQNISLSGTTLTGVTTPAWIILVGNLTYDATALPGTALTGSAVVTENTWDRGTSPTAATIVRYWWVDVPAPLKNQDYAGTITFASAFW